MTSRLSVTRPRLSREQQFVATANYMAKKRGVTERLRADDILALPAGPCSYCGDESADAWDHVIPLARGGPNTISNIVRCCRFCNQRKGARPVEIMSTPLYYTLLCGWCWAPIQKKSAQVRQATKAGRRYFTCSVEHRNALHAHRQQHGDLRGMARHAA